MSWIPGRVALPRIPESLRKDIDLFRWATEIQRAVDLFYRDLMEGTGGIHTQHYIARASADTTINSTARVDIAGATLTVKPRRQADAVVFGGFQVYQTAGTVLRIFRGELLVDGAVQSGQAGMSFSAFNEIRLDTQFWRVPNLKANVSYAFKLTGRCDNAADTFTAGGTDSAISVITAGQLG